jgi:hypothetical protein
MPTPKFHAVMYNMTAKRIREQLQAFPNRRTDYEIGWTNGMIEIALEFARAFRNDNPHFDPLWFLDACSPDPEVYPISELWD